MARGAEAVSRLAAEAGLLHATVDRAYRALQSAKDGHAPVGKVGGRLTAPHMELRHLRYLALSVTAQPITAAVEWVDQLCSLPLAYLVKDFSRYSFPRPEEAPPSVGGVRLTLNFGESFDRLIEAAATPEGKLRTARTTVEIVLHGERPSARIWAFGEARERCDAVYVVAASPDDPAEPRQAPGLVRTAAIQGRVLHALGDLWRDSLAHWANSRNLSDPGTTNPGTERAGTLAGAPALSDRPSEKGQNRPHTRKSRSLDSSRQSSAGARVRSSPSRKGVSMVGCN